MTAEPGLRTEEVPTCLLCQTEGMALYAGLSDRLFGAPGLWGFLRCPRCGLAWLNPRPLPEDLGKVYANYYTHAREDKMSGPRSLPERTRLAVYATLPGYSGLAPGWGWRQLGRGLCLLPPLREMASLGTMCLNGARKGKLLDVGCGNGRFLSLMRDAGWDVTGVEPDPEAARFARDHYGLSVVTGTVHEVNFPDGTFDAVTLSHVIEHVHDPVGLLAGCRRVLKPEGRVVVLTPNLDSRGHRVFRDAWRGLEPPRHIYLFTMGTLRACGQKAGLQIDALRTSARSARGMWAASRAVRDKGGFRDGEMMWGARILGLAFQAREEMALRASSAVGEELLLIGQRTA